MPATVKLTRHLIGVQIRRGRFDVLVDGTGVASIGAHETIETPVEPGHHTLQLRYGRYSSRTAAFDAAEGQVVAFRCGEKGFCRSFSRPSSRHPWRSRSSASNQRREPCVRPRTAAAMSSDPAAGMY